MQTSELHQLKKTIIIDEAWSENDYDALHIIP